MRKTLLGVLALVTLAAAASEAFAHRPRARVHFYFGPAWYWGPAYYYPPPYYYYPVERERPAEPPVYIERIDPAETGSWYYCEDSKQYYPYVKECPAGWRRVPAAPPG